jgi:hypothetical protein
VDASTPSFWVAGNSTPGANRITISTSRYSGDITCQVYDIVGAAPSPVDGIGGKTQFADPGGADLVNAPVFTPASAGLTLVAGSLGQGPCSGINPGSPQGAVFDFVYYTGETDLDLMENADIRAHVYNSTSAQQSWNWAVANGNTETTVSLTAVHFKGVP